MKICSWNHGESWGIRILRKLIFATHLMPNAWFSNPRHPDSNPNIIRKRNLETSMTKHILFHPSYPKRFQNGILNPLEISKNASLDPEVGAPRCPRIVPASPRTPKWTHQACQITSLGTNNLTSLAKIQRIHNLKDMSNGRGAGGRGRSP